LTAWHCLNDLARIKSGDNVLVHSATGGVGQAALAIASAAGAKIFATAGSGPRRQMLRDMGFEHVYDSHSVDFADVIRRDTDGYGVDIVLNSVESAAQRAGFELLAPGGRFIELGRGDEDSSLKTFPFRRNLAFHGFDLGLMAVTQPRLVQDLLTTVYKLTADGVLPMPASVRYPLAEAATALQQMSAAQHTGKLVLDIPRVGRSEVVLAPEQVRPFRSDGAYIVTGGFGGLGLFFAKNMAAAGCGLIVLTSDSRPDSKTLEAIDLIRAAGAEVVVECGDIAEPETADRVVAAATAAGLPVRGVLHAAAVIDDAALTGMTEGMIERHWAPKVLGAWNLHVATTDQPLEWFCSFSSAAVLVGSPGQGAYAAANSWLDGFTQWRRGQGHPAISIAWSGCPHIGCDAPVAGSDGVAIEPDEYGYAFDMLLRHDRAYTGYVPPSGESWLSTSSQHSPFLREFQSTGHDSSGSITLRAELDGLPPHEWPTRLRRLISDRVSMILRRSIDMDRALFEYGLDSLGVMELRTRIETETGVRVSTSDITTIHALADLLCEKLMPHKAPAIVATWTAEDASVA
jgi:polyketide synthase 5